MKCRHGLLRGPNVTTACTKDVGHPEPHTCQHGDWVSNSAFDMILPEPNKAIRPAYYGGADNPLEVIKIIEHYDLNFSLGNAVKYILRAGRKESELTTTDLKKARLYLDFEIARIEKLNG